MKKTHIKYISPFIVLILLSCSHSIVLKNMIVGGSGYFMFGENSERKFFQNISVEDNIKLKWFAETNGSQANTSVIIYDNILFVGDLSGKLYAFDRTSGEMFGYEKYSGSLSIAPIINNFRVFILLNQFNEKYSVLKIFDYVNGKVLFESNLYGSVQNEMIKLNDGVVVLTDQGELIKFNFIGSREWSLNIKTATKSSPASNGNLILFGNEKGELIAVSSNTGEIKYRINICNGIEGNFSIDGDYAYFGDNSGKLFCVLVNDGKIVWTVDTKSKILSTPVINEDKVFVGNLAGEIFCIDKSSGKINWEIETGGVINTTPLLFKNYLVQPDLNRKIYFIDTNSGEITKTYDFEKRVKLSPVYYDGILYLGADKGIINAYQISNKE
ncbi:MAG: PQQ-binding-like beta-propeller repeat protein [Ignavibacteriales bacterium]|nr:PQQ-binding-like beta-propeller repeat protein [Ignavibacteriales bacterium]